VVIPGTASFMRPLGADSDTEDGLNPHFVLVDEYHAHKSAEMLNVMESGMGARRQPLVFIITTAGKEKQCACFQEERALVVNILEKNIEPVPQNIFGIIYTLDDDDDWLDENTWIKANPNLGVSLSWDYLRKRVAEAVASPEKQNDVKTKNLNIWTQAETRWISSEAWKACPSKFIPDSLTGRSCYGGLDLSTNIDLTAWVLCFPPLDRGGEFIFLYRFFMPADNLLERQRRDRVPYVVWSGQGLITATPGNVIDYDLIESRILEDAAKYKIVEVAYDPYNATEIVNHLVDKGVNMIPHRQGFVSMSGPSKTFEEKVLARKINHGGNPVMTWMVSCTEIKYGEGDLIKPVKPDRKKTGKRIDGVIASVMALGRATMGTDTGSVYERQELMIL